LSIKVTRFYNKPVNSNCYIIQTRKNCLIIDPGSRDSNELIEYIQNNNLEPDYFIITHEHFDHIAGLNSLRQRYSIPVIASDICSEMIQDPKKNLSVFFDQIGFSCNAAEIKIIQKEDCLEWHDHTILFLKTPGHARGSICFQLSSLLFTGDTIIPDNKTVIKLPGGNKTILRESLEKIFRMYNGSTKIYPGHGKISKLSSISIDTLL